MKEPRAGRCVPAGEAGYLLGVGPVPVDGVSVGHHLGRRVLAVHAHPDDEDEEEDHFHLRHICSGTPKKPNRLQSARRLGSEDSDAVVKVSW